MPVNSIYGNGWHFPIVFNYSKGVKMTAGYNNIRQSLQILLSTLPGERVMEPEYGCDLQQFLFENIDDGLINRIKSTLEDAITVYEKRVTIMDINVDETPNQANTLLVAIHYLIKNTHEQGEYNTSLNLLGKV